MEKYTECFTNVVKKGKKPTPYTEFEKKLKTIVDGTLSKTQEFFSTISISNYTRSTTFICRNFVILTDLYASPPDHTVVVFAQKKFFVDKPSKNLFENRAKPLQVLVIAPEWEIVSKENKIKNKTEPIFNDCSFPEFVSIDSYLNKLKENIQKINGKSDQKDLHDARELIDNFVQNKTSDMKVGILWKANILLIQNGINFQDRICDQHNKIPEHHSKISFSFTDYFIDLDKRMRSNFRSYCYNYIKKLFDRLEKRHISFEYGTKIKSDIKDEMHKITSIEPKDSEIIIIEKLIQLIINNTKSDIPKPNKYKYQSDRDHYTFLLGLNEIESGINEEISDIEKLIETNTWYTNLKDLFNRLSYVVTKRQISKIENINIIGLLKVYGYNTTDIQENFGKFMKNDGVSKLNMKDEHKKKVLKTLLQHFVEKPTGNITTINDSNTLTIYGRFVKMSDVKAEWKKQLKEIEHINHLRLFAVYNLIFDVDFEAENVNLTIITPHMTVLNSRTLEIGKPNGKLEDYFFGFLIQEISDDEINEIKQLKVGLYNDPDEIGTLYTTPVLYTCEKVCS